MSKRCKHKRRSYTGRTRVDLDERGVYIEGTGKAIYVCCDCGKEVAR